GLWSVAHLSHPDANMAAAFVGHFVLFAGNSSGHDNFDIYDTQTGLWSTAPLPHTPIGNVAAVVGDQVLFTGAFDQASRVDLYDVPPHCRNAYVNIFSDESTVPHLDGSFDAPAPGRALEPGQTRLASLTLHNRGPSSLTSPYTINVYAHTDPSLRHAILVASL